MAKRISLRKAVQAGMGIAQNAHFSGLLKGTLYGGALKRFCAPGLNCYSCPAAVVSCPIGAFQSLLSQRKPKFSFYVFGFLSFLGVLLGRFVCGWLCLFGLFQELLYKIPTGKIHIPKKLDEKLRYLKYVILVVFVILFPVILRDEYGLSAPYFCKWLCPAGMLEGGIPLWILDHSIRPAAHFLYGYKLVLLLIMVAFSIMVERPFCKYICPLGAFYSLFQSVSFLKLEVNREACIHCGRCAKSCMMKVDPSKTPNSAECIRCGECVKACPAHALHFSINRKEQTEKAH